MDRDTDQLPQPRRPVFTGVLVIAIGTIFLLNNLGVLDARDVFHRSWLGPVAIIALGVLMMFRRRTC
jgi:hypothetical protein